jgi:hypothetical protein
MPTLLALGNIQRPEKAALDDRRAGILRKSRARENLSGAFEVDEHVSGWRTRVGRVLVQPMTLRYVSFAS